MQIQIFVRVYNVIDLFDKYITYKNAYKLNKVCVTQEKISLTEFLGV